MFVGRAKAEGVPIVRVLILIAILVCSAGCSALPDQTKTDRQMADEIVECMMEKGDGFGIAFMGGKDGVAEFLEQSSTRQQLITAREEECQTSKE